MILVCYDGSPDAKAAVERAAHLFPHETATVLTVWEPLRRSSPAIQHADRAVVIVPSPDVASARAREVHREAQ